MDPVFFSFLGCNGVEWEYGLEWACHGVEWELEIGFMAYNMGWILLGPLL